MTSEVKARRPELKDRHMYRLVPMDSKRRAVVEEQFFVTNEEWEDLVIVRIDRGLSGSELEHLLKALEAAFVPKRVVALGPGITMLAAVEESYRRPPPITPDPVIAAYPAATPLKCLFGFHRWATTYQNGPKQDRICTRCGREEHTVYDMSRGDTYWAEGSYWSSSDWTEKE